MKRFALVALEVLGWFLGAGMLAAALGSVSYTLALAAGGLLAIVAVVIFLFRRQPEAGRQPRLPNRWRALGISWAAAGLLITGSDGRQEWEGRELAEARETGDDAYLQRLRDLRGEGAWLAALQELDPERFEEEQARIADAERQREAAAQERREQEWRDREKQRVCDRVERWLLEAGTIQYQRDAQAGLQVLSVTGRDCVAEFRPDGLLDVQVTDITVAIADYPNPDGMIADAVVRPDDPSTPEGFERAICRMAWGPYDWFQVEEC